MVTECKDGAPNRQQTNECTNIHGRPHNTGVNKVHVNNVDELEMVVVDGHHTLEDIVEETEGVPADSTKVTTANHSDHVHMNGNGAMHNGHGIDNPNFNTDSSRSDRSHGSSTNGILRTGPRNSLTVGDVVEGKMVAMELKRSVIDISDLGDDNDDRPTYLPREFRSKRGVEIGSENLITNDDILLAATLVADARTGQSHDLKTEPRFVRSYNWYKSKPMRFTLYIAIIVNLSLALFEDPAHESMVVPYWVTMAGESVCLVIFTFRLSHHAYWRLPESTKKDAKIITATVCIIVTILDMLAYVFVLKYSTWTPIRWSRVLRPLLIMNFSDGAHLRRAWSNIRLTLHEIIHVIALFYFLIVVFALVAMKMFQKRTNLKFADGKDYFKTYEDSFWKLYVLVTTANNPDVMLPAYDSNRINFIFFTVYLILCLYLMLNILLAVTYNSYRENMKIQIRQSARQKRRSLNEAFEVIKINVRGKEMVTYKTWFRLIRLAYPRKTKHQIDLLMMVLDTDKTGYISRDQFSSVADLLNVPISQVSERKTFLEMYCPRLYQSKPSVSLRKFVGTIYFSLFYDGVVLVNVILICLEQDLLEWGFFGVYLLEILLKWYTYGTKRFFGRIQHWSDVILTLSSLIVLLLTNTDLARSGRVNPETLSVINVFRIFRILRCLIEFERFRIIFDCVINVSFSIFTYCGILFIVFYAFAIVGMEIFHGKIQYLGYNAINGTSPSVTQETCNNSALSGSAFVQNRYCNVNFNDLFSSFFVLASLLIVNNWHIIAEGFCLVTSSAARVYFMSFHLCVAVVVMNIVTAFILDMFMHEYTFTKKGNIDTKVEMTIKKLKLGMDDETGEDITEQRSSGRLQDGSSRASVFRRLTVKQRPTPQPNLSRYDGIRFHIKQRSWTKTELLLEQLFAVEEDGHEDEERH